MCALGPIAPWVVPPNYLGAAETGARTGLEARGQDIQYQEAGDRLRLAYDQLALEEKARARESASKMQLAQAALALNAQKANMLDFYRQEQVKNQQQRMADLMGYRSAELGQRQEAMGQREQAATAADALRRENLDLRREALDLRGQPKEAQVEVPVDPSRPFGAKIRGPLSDPEIRKLYDAAQKQAQGAASPDATKEPSGAQKVLNKVFGAIGSELDTLRNTRKDFNAPSAPSRTPPSSGTVIRYDESGRPVIFDPVTKKAIRYAD